LNWILQVLLLFQEEGYEDFKSLTIIKRCFINFYGCILQDKYHHDR